MDKRARAVRYAQDAARMIQIETVRCPGKDGEVFVRLHALMAGLFPRVEEKRASGSLRTACCTTFPAKTARIP